MRLLSIFVLITLRVSGASSYIDLKVRDVQTHFAVPATITADGPQPFEMTTDEKGHLKQPVAPGQYSFEVTAHGYARLKSSTAVNDNGTVSVFIMLDPVNPPEEETATASRLRPDRTLLRGYAIDADGQPVSGVKVRLQDAKLEAISDQRGFYWLSVPTPQGTGGLPGTDTIIAERDGFKTLIFRNMIVTGEDGGGVFFELEAGDGIVEHDATHKLMRK